MTNETNNENMTANPCIDRMETFNAEERIPFTPLEMDHPIEERRGVKTPEYCKEKGATRAQHKMEAIYEWKRFKRGNRYMNMIHPMVERGVARMERVVRNANELCLKLVMERRGRIHRIAQKIRLYEQRREEYLDLLNDCIRRKEEFCRNVNTLRDRLSSYCANVDGYTEQADCGEFTALCSKVKDFDLMFKDYREHLALLSKAAHSVDDAIAGIRRDVTSRKSQKTAATVRVYKNPRKYYKFHHYR